ncbi:MAG: AhpC/TSA family protein [Bacteroidetes bacterium]|nr:AhpC/TSA family protein [Bacteroidota bacterium]MBU1578868.1 AhpC/TSA family protein [Bacteroidota bacterium]MBU2464733.1 AhpC/TSA family protein [Bacteroidota bacterium]MBU2558709.1 AhpC/TSA family protein [Bacteroidota bacterium]
MKNILFLFTALAAVMLFSCQSPEASDKFVVDVNIQHADGKMISLEKRVDGEWVKVDSARAENGQLQLSGTIDSPEIYYLTIEETRGAIPVFVEAATITINADGENLKEHSITGSAVNDRYKAFTQKITDFDDQLQAHYTAYQNAGSNNDSVAMEAAEVLYDETELEKNNFLVNYAKENNADVVSHYIIYRNTYQFDLEELEAIVINFEPTPKSSYLDALYERVKVLKNVAVGQPFVDFEQENPEGEMVALSSKVGAKVLLVDFWASWCQPCRAENPNIVAIFNDYNDKGFDVFGVSFDTDSTKWNDAIIADQLDWTHVSDLEGWGNAAGKLYGVQSIPHSVLLDAEGTIIAKNLRGKDLRDKVATLLDPS